MDLTEVNVMDAEASAFAMEMEAQASGRGSEATVTEADDASGTNKTKHPERCGA